MNGHEGLQCEWDEGKNKKNGKKHGISFERAATVLLDPRALSQFDDRHSQIEDRWITMGIDNTGVLLVVCHTYRKQNHIGALVRVVSARKATKRETSQYEKP